jgi:hypothetical protein
MRGNESSKSFTQSQDIQELNSLSNYFAGSPKNKLLINVQYSSSIRTKKPK